MGELKRILLTLGTTLQQTEIDLPASKSIANRLLVVQMLSDGAISLENLGDADDTRYLQAALDSTDGKLFMGDAGTALRFGLAWAAITPGLRVISGSPRLSERPISTLVDALREIGADIEYLEKDGFAPLQVKGKKLTGGALKINGSVSSQFISAILLVAPYFTEGLELTLDENQVSKPYISMTIECMRMAGAQVRWEGNSIAVEAEPYQENLIEIEPDWSAAAFFYTAAALHNDLKIRLKGLSKSSIQGDRLTPNFYAELGVVTTALPKGLLIESNGEAGDKKIFDFIDCPDLAPAFATVAAGLRMAVKLTGLQTLRVKETDRINALAQELRKCGVRCKEGDDYLELTAFEELTGTPSIATYGDHRMAMAFAPLVFSLGELIIESPEVVSKSFPGFWKELGKLGVEMGEL